MINNPTSSNPSDFIMNNNQSSVTRNNENKESITLLWFDPDIGSDEYIEQTKKQLRLINDYVVFYTDLEICIRFIESINNEKILLITSGSRASQLLPRISTLPQIDSIFIFCTENDKYQDLINEYSKLIGIYSDLDTLYKSIQEQINLLDKQLQTFCAFDHYQRSTTFLWFQLFRQIILRLPQNQQDKQQMINFCRYYYRGNTKQLNLIDQFEREYRAEEAIRWYLKQSFVYRLVDKALRSEDIHQLQIFRFFMCDLSENLAGEHEKILSSEEKMLTVYRGVQLHKEEFNKLKENQGKLISANGYLSTNRLRSSALDFAMKPTKRTDVISVLFQIECDVQQLGKSVIFADISQFSEYPNEQEVLFDLGTAFRLESIGQDGAVQFIRLSASKDELTLTKNYIEETRQGTRGKSIGIVFGRLICNVGQYHKSQKHFEQLLNSSNGEDLAWIEFNIGRALHLKGEWKVAREYYDRSYDRMIYEEPARIKDSAQVLENIGEILFKQGEYDVALDYCQRALKIRKKYYPSAHVGISHSLHKIGAILINKRKYDEALDYSQRALKIRENCYPSGHVYIANSLHDTGAILINKGKYDEALDYCQRALIMEQKYYPSGHFDIANSLNNIGLILDNQGKYDEALDYCQRALVMEQKYYPSGHFDIANSLNNIGLILDNQGKYDEALDYHQRALKIREKCYPSGHVYIANSLHDIGAILINKGKYAEALDYCQRALVMEQKYYPSGHVDIGHNLDLIGLCYEKLNKPNVALYYYQQALIMHRKFLPVGHSSRAKAERNIDRISEKK